jgi:hypothetical protein
MENVKNITPELAISEELQKECYSIVDFIMAENQTISRQSALNVWLFKKLGDIEFRLRKLEGERNVA